MSFKLIYLARRAAGISRQDWPRTWKSHAVFASQFPVLEARIEWMRYCNRIDSPLLDGKPVDLPVLSTEHDGVAVAASETLEGLNGAGFTSADRALIDEDERRVFDMLTPHFTFFAAETVLKDGALGEAALFRFLPAAAGVTREQFRQRFAASLRDSPALASGAGMTRCAVNDPVNDPLPLFPFDGIVECWFASADDAVRALADEALAPFDRALAAFSDLARSVTVLTSVVHRWSREARA